MKNKKSIFSKFLYYICLPIALITIVVCICNFVIELRETRQVVNTVDENLEYEDHRQKQEIEEYRNSIYENEHDEYNYYYGE